MLTTRKIISKLRKNYEFALRSFVNSHPVLWHNVHGVRLCVQMLLQIKDVKSRLFCANKSVIHGRRNRARGEAALKYIQKKVIFVSIDTLLGRREERERTVEEWAFFITIKTICSVLCSKQGCQTRNPLNLFVRPAVITTYCE